MTGPLSPNTVGRVDADLRIDTDKVPGDVRQGLREAEAQTNKDVEGWGDRAGDTFAKRFGSNAGRGTRQHFNDLGNEFSDILTKIRGDFNLDFTPEDESRARRRGRSWISAFFSGIRDFLSGGGGGGGQRSALGNLFQSAVLGPTGAFFNVGGRSPLVALLIPLLGYIISLVTAAIYGLSAMISLLYLVPSLLFAIGLQVSALFFIFGGLGEVISAAFAANTPAELEEALKGVRAEVADVIRALYPLKEFFKTVRDSAQFAFFDVLDATKITAVLDRIQGPFGQAIVNIAAALGGVANNLLDVFASPTFGQLIKTLGDSTVQWLSGFGPALASFIDGLNNLGIAIDPFLDWFGQQFNQTIANWGAFLTGLGQDPAFLGWVEDAKDIMGDFMDLLGTIVQAVVVFVQQFGNADKQIEERFGGGFLEILAAQTKAFIDFLASPLGREALEGFIYLLLILSGAFYGLVIILAAVVGAFVFLGKSIGAFFEWLGGTAIPRIGDFFEWLGTHANEITTTIGTSFGDLTETIGSFFSRLGTTVNAGLVLAQTEITNFLSGLPQQLLDAGYNVLRSLGDGMLNALPGLRSVLSTVASVISSFFPHSPAEQGPLSGDGDPFVSGKTFVQRLIAGIAQQGPMLGKVAGNTANTMKFDPGAVQVNYYGQNPPSQQTMQAMGRAAGRGIVGEMNATRIAVRTL